MSTSTTPAIEDLLDRADEAGHGEGFTYSAGLLKLLLEECSPLTSVGVHDIRHWSSDEVSVKITVYATFSRSELVSA